MTEYQPLGRLHQAPLVYSLGVVLISLKNLDEYTNRLQDALRDDYPGYDRMEVEISRPDPAQPLRMITEFASNHAFNSPGLDWGVVVTPDRIALQTTAYKDFADFSKRLQSVLDAVVKVTSLKYFSGLAFRQIDNVSPIDGETDLRDCVQARHLPPNWPAEYDRLSNRQESTARLGAIQVMTRTYAFMHSQGPQVPQDLYPFYVGLVKNPDDPETVMAPRQAPYVLADFEAAEHFGGRSEPLEPAAVIKKMDTLHQQTSIAFRQTMLQDAITRRRRGQA